MARVPFIGRLFWREYIALFGSLVLVALEVFVRIITLGLPQPIIRFCYNTSRKVFNRLSSQRSKQARSQNKSLYSSIATCSDFTDLCALFDYYAEEHVVQTSDGYLLGVHRLPFRKGEENSGARVNAGPDSLIKPVVYLHHGLLMNSEVWVCLTEEERCLPFVLASKGYDVWLGNNRGNKYSKKSTKHSPTSPGFWNFSMDEFAFHDIPDTIDYVLNTTSQPSLSYIGFSQGTAQAFATLSIHPGLNEKVNLFIALAPAMAPAGLSNGIVDSLVKASPDVLFLAFGRKSILSSATMWQSILYQPIFVRLIDMSLSFLFAWYGKNISVQQKLAAYPHLYSFTSTKSVVHWFQIIRNKSFQMYDDDASTQFSIGATNRYYKVAKFPTRNIKTPIVLVYGGSDSLIDIRVMLKELPRHTISTEIPHFEHLDFLWAQDVDKLVFPHVLEALQFYSHGRSRNGIPKGLALSIADTAYLHRRNHSGSTTPWSEDEGGYSDYDGTAETPRTPRIKSYAQLQREQQYQSPNTSTQAPAPARAGSGQGPIQSPSRASSATSPSQHLWTQTPSNSTSTGREDQSQTQTRGEEEGEEEEEGQNSIGKSTSVSIDNFSMTTSTPKAKAKAKAPQSQPQLQKSRTIHNAAARERERDTDPPDADADSVSVAATSGRSSPSMTGNTTPILPTAFTPKGIRVGSSRPSIGLG
ncbi:hypothetical protein PV10_06155 [Exophiala mesophila]|uniref:AB hydrolase-1 domain-containing protein n=1 Tax=Exophiala mesophila TaxID=212818 RepID=A0A0D1ZCI4_EXOME|nr:uncharacterized protein PV10_06155 [Exophiala mesophila]KIV91639.1 hypothetical protein PV10_06155 [Exophiala mesophila]